ncbi:endonuclease domain-containing 1 protein-like [Ornithorhynchus anatinus]|uniref:endonuclease domain-containing 1 protein-like n=1 Tax=Ornithorhynchus anatinus TaxID=9258 RepID=UPI0001554D29|nr:endonuclease domain-containing 1 protein-like [Ornithorhynchus anatinus]
METARSTLPLLLVALALGPGSGEVVTSFSQVPACARFFFQDQEPEGFTSMNVTHLCQRLRGRYFYATLYALTLRLPLYSAYILEESTTSRPNIDSRSWFLEPMLAGLPLPDMESPSSSRLQGQMARLEKSQAVDRDFRGSGLSRGHLNPSGHHSREAQLATFTYSNMAPQDIKFNSGPWARYESWLRDALLPTCAIAHVLTGVLPSGARPGEGTWLRGRVNVPLAFWSAACCSLPTGAAEVHARLADNSPSAQVRTVSLAELEHRLTQAFGKPVRLFPAGCPTPDTDPRLEA